MLHGYIYYRISIIYLTNLPNRFAFKCHIYLHLSFKTMYIEIHKIETPANLVV